MTKRSETREPAALLAEIDHAGRERIPDLPGFDMPPITDPYRPLLCTFCGCLIAHGWAETHRGRCAR